MFVIDDIIKGIGGMVAGQQQADAAKHAMGIWDELWPQQQRNISPFMDAGRGALGSLTNLARMGPQQLNPQDIANDPGYQFQLEQGMKALQRSAAAKGSLRSGGTLKGLADYSGGLAASQYQNAWQRNQQAYQNRFNSLFGLAGLGLNSANSLGQFGNQYGNAMSQLFGAKGNAESAGTQAMFNGAAESAKSLINMATLGAGGGMGGMMGGMGGFLGGGGGGASTGYIPTQGFNIGSLVPGGG